MVPQPESHASCWAASRATADQAGGGAPKRWRSAALYGSLVAIAVAGASGCLSSAPQEVVVYAALDEEFSRPVFEQFSRETGIVVRAKFDVESTKTVGLVQALLAERARPRCDVFWNNEIVNTLRLDRAEMLAPYASVAGEAFPAQVRSPQRTWHGFAARARVLLVNDDLLSADEAPQRLEELIEPQWRGRVGVAKPLAGTTATHAACLYAVWGNARAREFWSQLRDQAQVLGGNKQVAQAVAQGALACGLTDTDDAIVEIERGSPVRIVLLDQEEGGLGTLLIPNTLAIVAGGPHPTNAQRLVDYLLRPEIERRLAEGPSAQIPLHPEVQARSRALPAGEVRAMEVDFERAAAAWDEAAADLRALFAS
jgi:iron(III) transport system substrate-binding protein